MGIDLFCCQPQVAIQGTAIFACLVTKNNLNYNQVQTNKIIVFHNSVKTIISIEKMPVVYLVKKLQTGPLMTLIGTAVSHIFYVNVTV